MKPKIADLEEWAEKGGSISPIATLELLRIARAAKAFITADDNFGVYYGDDRDIEATDRFRKTDDELRAALDAFDWDDIPRRR